MEQFNLLDGNGSSFSNGDHQNGGDVHMSHAVPNNEIQQPMGSDEKKAAIDEEIRKVKQLHRPNSSYATHRMRVLNKILQLLSVQRTISQDEELEKLFASLSI